MSRIFIVISMALAIGVGFAAPVGASPAPVAVATCGQSVPPRTLGYLTGDLDCTGSQSGGAAIAAVFVEKGGSLELRGHSIRGSLFGIACARFGPDRFGNEVLGRHSSCEIDGGGGVVADTGSHGVVGKAVRVRNLTIRDAGEQGLYAQQKATVDNVTITDSQGFGAEIYKAGKVRNSTITGNGLYGIDAGTLYLAGSTVTGNGVASRCDTDPLIRCADLHVYRRPRLFESTCGTSVLASDFHETWGVCQDD